MECFSSVGAVACARCLRVDPKKFLARVARGGAASLVRIALYVPVEGRAQLNHGPLDRSTWQYPLRTWRASAPDQLSWLTFRHLKDLAALICEPCPLRGLRLCSPAVHRRRLDWAATVFAGSRRGYLCAPVPGGRAGTRPLSRPSPHKVSILKAAVFRRCCVSRCSSNQREVNRPLLMSVSEAQKYIRGFVVSFSIDTPDYSGPDYESVV